MDHLDGWLQGHNGLFDSLVDDAHWSQHRRKMYDRFVDVPRMVARCPQRGSAATILRRMSLALSMRYGVALPSISLAWYRDGQDSVAPHGDRLGGYTAQSVVAIVSIGEPRRFTLKPNRGGESKHYSLGWGDLIVMGGTCQDTWQHGVPKVACAQPRISIVFRERDD